MKRAPKKTVDTPHAGRRDKPRVARTRQYTIRAVPQSVDSALREQARSRRQSLNDVVLEALAKYSGVNGGKQVYHDLDHFIGTWVEDPAFDQAIADQKKIDDELWR